MGLKGWGRTNQLFQAGLFLILTSCGSEMPIPTTGNLGETLGQTSASSALSVSTNPKINNYIAFDVLGGVFRKTTEGSSMTLDDDNTISTDKSSISIPPPDQKNATSPGVPVLLDVAYSYVGSGGSGKLMITLSGMAEDQPIAGDPTHQVRNFHPLKLRFLFFNYAYKNKCIGMVHVDGEILCDVDGQYNTATGKFLGKAHCTHGPTEQPQTMLYMTTSDTFEIGVDADMIINGDPFNFGSYRNSGKIWIDGAEKKVEDLFTSGGTCS